MLILKFIALIFLLSPPVWSLAPSPNCHFNLVLHSCVHKSSSTILSYVCTSLLVSGLGHRLQVGLSCSEPAQHQLENKPICLFFMEAFKYSCQPPGTRWMRAWPSYAHSVRPRPQALQGRLTRPRLANRQSALPERLIPRSRQEMTQFLS